MLKCGLVPSLPVEWLGSKIVPSSLLERVDVSPSCAAKGLGARHTTKRPSRHPHHARRSLAGKKRPPIMPLKLSHVGVTFPACWFRHRLYCMRPMAGNFQSTQASRELGVSCRPSGCRPVLGVTADWRREKGRFPSAHRPQPTCMGGKSPNWRSAIAGGSSLRSPRDATMSQGE